MRVPADVLRKCWFLAGATACGKTATGIELAKHLNAEVLSLVDCYGSEAAMNRTTWCVEQAVPGLLRRLSPR